MSTLSSSGNQSSESLKYASSSQRQGEREFENAAHFYHIGDVATLTGLSADALRAWERVGLLTPRRSAAGVRRYMEDDLARIRLIARTLQQGGYSRRAVARLLQSGDLRPDAADYAPGPARVRRSRRGGNHGRLSPGSERQDLDEKTLRDQNEQDEVRSERRTLDAVARISDALASGRALDEVLQVICSEACRAFGVSDTILWLVDPPLTASSAFLNQISAVPRKLIAAAAYGPHSAALLLSSHLPHLPNTLSGVTVLGAATELHGTMQLSIPLDDQHAPAVRALLTRHGLIVNSASPAHPWQAHTELSALLPGTALLIVPLLATSGTPIGVLSLSEELDSERFNSDDLERVRLFAVQATLAIVTARLYVAIRAARQEAEEHRVRWQAAVDDLPALVCICDSALSITYVSPTCGQVLGWPKAAGSMDDSVLADSADHSEAKAAPSDSSSRAETRSESGSESWVTHHGFFWLGQTTAPNFVTPGSPDRADVQATLDELPLPRALHEHKAVHDITIVHRCPNGLERLIAWDAAPMRTARGEMHGAVAVGRDVTQEYRQRERENCLAAVTRAVVGAPDAHGIEGRATRVLIALVAHTRKPVIAATLYLLDEEKDLLRRVGAFGVEQSGTHAPTIPLTRQHPWWQLLIEGPVYSSPNGTQPRWLRAIGLAVWKASSIRAWATVPLRADGKLVGALSMGLSVPHVWDMAERTWLEACADVVVMGVENDRLFAAEQQKSSALEALLTAANEKTPLSHEEL